MVSGHTDLWGPLVLPPEHCLSVCTAAHHCEECPGAGLAAPWRPCRAAGATGTSGSLSGDTGPCPRLGSSREKAGARRPCGHVELRARCGDEVLRTRRGGPGGSGEGGCGAPRGRVGFPGGCLTRTGGPGPEPSRRAGPSAGDRVDSGPRGLGRPQPLSASAKTRLALPWPRDLSLSRLHRNRRGPARGPGLQPGGALGLGGARQGDGVAGAPVNWASRTRHSACECSAVSREEELAAASARSRGWGCGWGLGGGVGAPSVGCCPEAHGLLPGPLCVTCSPAPPGPPLCLPGLPQSLWPPPSNPRSLRGPQPPAPRTSVAGAAVGPPGGSPGLGLSQRAPGPCLLRAGRPGSGSPGSQLGGDSAQCPGDAAMELQSGPGRPRAERCGGPSAGSPGKRVAALLA